MFCQPRVGRAYSWAGRRQAEYGDFGLFRIVVILKLLNSLGDTPQQFV